MSDSLFRDPFLGLNSMEVFSAVRPSDARKFGKTVRAYVLSNREYERRFNRLKHENNMMPPPSSVIHVMLGYLVVRKLGTPNQYETWMPDQAFGEAYVKAESTYCAKHRFLRSELGLLTLKASLSTRSSEWPIYRASVKVHQRGREKDAFREILLKIEETYSSSEITEVEHVRFIESVANRLTAALGGTLHKGRFRVGVSQKLVNLHLKYLWVAGVIPEPLHCPVDGIIRNLAGIDYDWIRSDCLNEYRAAIAQLRVVAEPMSLSRWELENFRRRGDLAD